MPLLYYQGSTAVMRATYAQAARVSMRCLLIRRWFSWMPCVDRTGTNTPEQFGPFPVLRSCHGRATQRERHPMIFDLAHVDPACERKPDSNQEHPQLPRNIRDQLERSWGNNRSDNSLPDQEHNCTNVTFLCGMPLVCYNLSLLCMDSRSRRQNGLIKR